MVSYGQGFIAGQSDGNVEQWTGTEWKTLGQIDNSADVATLRPTKLNPLTIIPFRSGVVVAATNGLDSTSIEQWDGQGWSQLGSWGTTLALKDALVAYQDRFAVALADGTVQQWDGTNWTTVIDDSPATAIMALKDRAGDGFVIGQKNGELRQWTGTQLNDLASLDSAVTALAPVSFGGEAGSFIAGLEDGTIKASYVGAGGQRSVDQLQDGQKFGSQPVKTIIPTAAVGSFVVGLADASLWTFTGDVVTALADYTKYAGWRQISQPDDLGNYGTYSLTPFGDGFVERLWQLYKNGSAQKESGHVRQWSPQATVAANGKTTLTAGESLKAGEWLTSPNGLYTLTLQDDGNLVLSGVRGGVLWSAMTNSTFAGYEQDAPKALAEAKKFNDFSVVMQSDGNVVLYGIKYPSNALGTKTTKALWSSDSARTSGQFVTVQNDGNAVLYNSAGTTSFWSTGTSVGDALGEFGGSSATSAGTWRELDQPPFELTKEQLAAAIQYARDSLAAERPSGYDDTPQLVGVEVADLVVVPCESTVECAAIAAVSSGSLVYSQDKTPLYDRPWVGAAGDPVLAGSQFKASCEVAKSCTGTYTNFAYVTTDPPGNFFTNPVDPNTDTYAPLNDAQIWKEKVYQGSAGPWGIPLGTYYFGATERTSPNPPSIGARYDMGITTYGSLFVPDSEWQKADPEYYSFKSFLALKTGPSLNLNIGTANEADGSYSVTQTVGSVCGKESGCFSKSWPTGLGTFGINLDVGYGVKASFTLPADFSSADWNQQKLSITYYDTVGYLYTYNVDGLEGFSATSVSLPADLEWDCVTADGPGRCGSGQKWTGGANPDPSGWQPEPTGTLPLNDFNVGPSITPSAALSWGIFYTALGQELSFFKLSLGAELPIALQLGPQNLSGKDYSFAASVSVSGNIGAEAGVLGSFTNSLTYKWSKGIFKQTVPLVCASDDGNGVSTFGQCSSQTSTAQL